MLPSTLAKRGCLLLFLLIIAFYFYGLGLLPFVGPDEPRYAQVAREMFLRGDLITPTLGGHTWFEKPILLYWMIGAGFRLFGVSEWAARLGPAACGVLTIAAVYWVGRRTEVLSGDPELRNLGCWSALILASTPGIIVFSRGASFDIVVTMTLTWALSFFLLAELAGSEKRRRWLMVGFYASVGLSLLAKGLIGIVIPFGVVLLYLVLCSTFGKRWFISSLLWGIPLALAVAAIWYGPVIARHGWPFIQEFFIQHHFARYLSNKYHHPQPIFYYLIVIVPLALPWVVLTIQGIVNARRWNWRGNTPVDRLRVFAFAWILMPLIFFSFSGSKLPGYILPVLPGMALIAGERLTRTIAGKQLPWTMRLMASALVLCASGTIAYSIISGTLQIVCATLMATPLFIAALLLFRFRTLKEFSVVSIVVAIPLSFVIALNCDVPTLSEAHSARLLISRANARGYSSAPLYALHEVDRSSEFYAAGRIVYDAHGEPVKFEGANQVLVVAQQRKSPVLIIVPLKYVGQLTDLKSADVEIIAENGVLAIVGVRPRN